jgi:hypothetical protein
MGDATGALVISKTEGEYGTEKFEEELEAEAA